MALKLRKTDRSKIQNDQLDSSSKTGSFVDILAISCDSFVEETNVRVGRGRGEHLRKLEEIKKWCVEYKAVANTSTPMQPHRVTTWTAGFDV